MPARAPRSPPTLRSSRIAEPISHSFPPPSAQGVSRELTKGGRTISPPSKERGTRGVPRKVTLRRGGRPPPHSPANRRHRCGHSGGATQLSINIFTDARENTKVRTVKPRTCARGWSALDGGPRGHGNGRRRGYRGAGTIPAFGNRRPNRRIIAFIYIFRLTRGILYLQRAPGGTPGSSRETSTLLTSIVILKTKQDPTY